MHIEALVISVDEPQLEKCLESVRNQTVPFSNIIHINNVIPESVAFNTGIQKLSSEWMMHIGGDFILYPNAVETAFSYLSKDNGAISMYSFGLYDGILNGIITGCGVYRSKIWKIVRHPNMLTDDHYAGKKLRKMGFEKKKPVDEGIVLGTHCENADEFQIFRRFYTIGVKGKKGFVLGRLKELREETKNAIYDLALNALKFGDKKRYYPSSHNINFDRKMFEEFKSEYTQGDLAEIPY